MARRAEDKKQAAEVGRQAEDAVLRCLLSHGYELLSRNFSVPRLGELDLILRRGTCILIVEVKSRRVGDAFGGPAEAVTAVKRARMTRTARFFLLDPRWSEYDVHFAAGCVSHNSAGEIQNIEILPI